MVMITGSTLVSTGSCPKNNGSTGFLLFECMNDLLTRPPAGDLVLVSSGQTWSDPILIMLMASFDGT